MKKTLLVLVFISTTLMCYGSCFKATNPTLGETWYGQVKTKDFASGNINMQNIQSCETCNGFWFIANPKVISTQNSKIYARLGCQSGKLIELKVNEKLSGEAQDQQKNMYQVTMVKKKEYNRSIKKIKKECNATKL